ncbi:hypothetical protein GW17_00031232 [Ensete ventricosum]|nr:hypothetical protein GW17_00031232 [Ensete ventricosum]
MPWVGHRPNLGFVYGLLPLVSRAINEVYPEPTCTAAPAEVPVEGVGKHSDEGGSEPSRKKTKVTVSKRLKKAALGEGSERAHRSKGKEPMKEATESPNHPPTVRELCEVDGWAGKDMYFVVQISELSRPEAEGPLKLHWPNLAASSWVWTDWPLATKYVRGVLHPSLAKQLYEASFEELMDRATKAVVWGPYFAGALVDRVHDAGWVVRLLIERNSMLRVENKELKLGTGPEDVAATEKRATELSTEVERLKVLTLTQDAKVLRSELKTGRGKAIANYKGSRGFQFGLEKMGQITYEFGYQVALEARKIPDLICREGPLC